MAKAEGYSNIALGFRPATHEIKALSDVFNFGQYAGSTVEDVLHDDPGYILWLDEKGIVEIRDYEILWMAEMNEQDNFDRQYEGGWLGRSIWDFIGDD